MSSIIKSVKGTQDILPKEIGKWKTIEDIMQSECSYYGFKEIRTPVFEHTELFNHSVGETSDVVQKEMYTFDDKSGRSITLRPEGTAGSVRAMLEHALYNEGLPVKVNYFTTCYRYEKPQAGRLREFRQFGVEIFGAPSPSADAELISLATSIFSRIGLKNILLEINSIGCPTCREEYSKALKNYFSNYKDKLCQTCLDRLNRNPMRLLDCKSEVCSEIAKDAPQILDYICDDCKSHFDTVKSILDSNCIEYKVNPRIVRGLDYYSKTVFEFISKDLGAQSTVCGGGRYDGLVKQLGGQDTPAIGFAIGLERLLLIAQKQGIEFPEDKTCDVYIGSIGDAAQIKSFNLANKLRSAGFIVECDLMNKSIKAQMKYADKINAKFSLIIGDDEITSGKSVLKNMESKEQTTIDINDDFLDQFFEAHIKNSSKGLESSLQF